jgi:hypothetical protein
MSFLLRSVSRQLVVGANSMRLLILRNYDVQSLSSRSLERLASRRQSLGITSGCCTCVDHAFIREARVSDWLHLIAVGD